MARLSLGPGSLGLEFGDKVVYPHHGAGTMVKKEKRTILGQEREYLTIKILRNDMTVNVRGKRRALIRKVIDESLVEQLLEVLNGGGTQGCRRTGIAASSTTGTR